MGFLCIQRLDNICQCLYNDFHDWDGDGVACLFAGLGVVADDLE